MRNRTYTTIILLSLVLCSSLIFAQNTFVRIYPGQPSNIPNQYVPSGPNCLEKTIGGGFLIGGAAGEPDTPGMAKMQLRKVDIEGNLIWEVKDRVTFNDEIIDLVEYNDSTIFCAAQIGSKAALVKRNGQG